MRRRRPRRAGAGRSEVGVEPLRKGLGTVEAEDGAAAGVGFEEVGEAGFDAGGLVAERERAAGRGEILGEALAVLAGSGFRRRSGERLPSWLRRRRRPIRRRRGDSRRNRGREREEFANGDSAAGVDVDAVAILDEPSGSGQQAVDVGAGAIFGTANGWRNHALFVSGWHTLGTTGST